MHITILQIITVVPLPELTPHSKNIYKTSQVRTLDLLGRINEKTGDSRNSSSESS